MTNECLKVTFVKGNNLLEERKRKEGQDIERREEVFNDVQIRVVRTKVYVTVKPEDFVLDSSLSV